MADSKYGRLFTEADVKLLMDWAHSLGQADWPVPDDAIEAYERVDGRSGPFAALAATLTFPADEPLFLLRGQDALASPAIHAYYTLVGDSGCSQEHYKAAVEAQFAVAEWQAANPDRVKVPD